MEFVFVLNYQHSVSDEAYIPTIHVADCNVLFKYLVKCVKQTYTLDLFQDMF